MSALGRWRELDRLLRLLRTTPVQPQRRRNKFKLRKDLFMPGPCRGRLYLKVVSPQRPTFDLEMSTSPKPAKCRHPLQWTLESASLENLVPGETQEDQEKQGTRGLHTLLRVSPLSLTTQLYPVAVRGSELAIARTWIMTRSGPVSHVLAVAPAVAHLQLLETSGKWHMGP